MIINNILETIKEKLKAANEKGIYIPMVHDPTTKEGSVSLTLVVISSFLVIVGIIGKWGLALKLDLEQALNFFYAASALYWGRKLSNKNTTLETDSSKNSEKQ